MNKTRRQRILNTVDVSRGVGLEIGPLMAPIVTKDAAKRVYYLDHMSQKDLIEKYGHEPMVDTSKIEPVDFVVDKKSLKSSVGNMKFDYIVASHVIEHMPDLISWLQEVEEILKIGGVLALAIPDKRYTFDISRRTSTVNEVMVSYFDKLHHSSNVMMYDYYREYRHDVDSQKAWSEKDYVSTLNRRWTKQEAINAYEDNKAGKYLDCHCFTFTPYSFIEILRELITEKLVNLEVVNFIETIKNDMEFHISLRKVSSKESIKSRIDSLPKVINYERQEMKLELEEAHEEIELHKQKIVKLENSNSWKLTKPLRKTKSNVINLKRARK
ncbi:MAG: methyltransferase domain-containing protein [Parachlamydiaceae bacterium]